MANTRNGRQGAPAEIQASQRLRRANDAVLTEMARSLLREDRPAEDASAGRSAAAEAARVRHASQRFRREPHGTRVRPPHLGGHLVSPQA